MSKESSTTTVSRRARLAKNLADSPDADLAAREETMASLIDTLLDDERMKAHQLADQLDLNNHEAILSFGMSAQTEISSLTDVMLEHVKKSDITEVGGVMRVLMKKLDEVKPDELTAKPKSFFGRIFSRQSGSVRETISKYQKISALMDRISVKLERSKETILDDIKMLETLYEHNQDYFQQLTVYIAAGQMRLKQLYGNKIPDWAETAEKANDPMNVQKRNDLIQLADILDKRLYDLKISRETAVQNAAQIRMLQQANKLLSEKIQSSILTTIPLWRNQMAIALTVLKQRQAEKAKEQTVETNTRLFRNNARIMNSAREMENDPEAVKIFRKTQKNLIAIVEETLQLEEEGRNKRQQAEHELTIMRDSSLVQ